MAKRRRKKKISDGAKVFLNDVVKVDLDDLVKMEKEMEEEKEKQPEKEVAKTSVPKDETYNLEKLPLTGTQRNPTEKQLTLYSRYVFSQLRILRVNHKLEGARSISAVIVVER